MCGLNSDGNCFFKTASAVLDQLLSCKSGTPLSDDLLLLAFDLGTSWKRLGRVLGLPEPVLEQIEEDKRELFEKCYGVLRIFFRLFLWENTKK